ncbi:recombination directionality factor [Mycobacterium phage Magnar]|nr:recombination directionality factor [Mycobacterium phage Magnar]
MTQRIAVLPDVQLPYSDIKALRGFIQFVADTQPDVLLGIGDYMDYPSPARWSKGSAEEFLPQLQKHNEIGKKFLQEIRDVYDGPFLMHEGNHDLRPRQYLARYAPALGEMEEAFHFQNMLDFDSFGIELLPDFYDIAPGWISTHGHMGKISLSQIAGSTALNGAKKFQKSIVMGHTHRLAVVNHSFGYAGRVVQTVTGFEVGHMMDQKQAKYLQLATGNWQQGFGILTVDGKHVKAEAVPISQGKFTVDGETWRL